MKKFTFSLEGLLKFREFKEKRLKAELGDIVSEMERLKQEIIDIGQDITTFHQQQEDIFKGVIQARNIQQFPNFIEGLKAKRGMRQGDLVKTEARYQEKIRELSQAMADVKLVENLKEKRRGDHVRQEEKKAQQDIEENYIMRKRFDSQ